MRHYVYHDLPFAIFAYAPDQEWVMRGEIVAAQDAAGADDAAPGGDHLAGGNCSGNRSRRAKGWLPLSVSNSAVASKPRSARCRIISLTLCGARCLTCWPSAWPDLTPRGHIGFLVRTGALAPSIYRVSKLLDEMKGRTRVPCVPVHARH
jgi:hypothetical protein